MQEVTVEDMARAREARAEKQRDFLTHYGKPLVSFMLNIPGAVKAGGRYDAAFDEGVRRIETVCAAGGIALMERAVFRLFTGNEYYAVLDGCAGKAGSADHIKELLMQAEERDALGRLFDIDVLRADGTKVSRRDIGLPERTCLLCENDAHACARNRTHTVADLVSAIDAIICTWQQAAGA